MLSMNSYSKDYIDECRSLMEAQLISYKALIATAKKQTVDSFEPLFLNNLVLVLDNFFVHRSRTLEKKDGNPLNEVRLLCNSILQNQGIMTADKSIKYNAAKSILKLQIGDKIQLTETNFELLFQAFFTEMNAKFSEK